MIAANQLSAAMGRSAPGRGLLHPREHATSRRRAELRSVTAFYTNELNVPAAKFVKAVSGHRDRTECFAIDYAGKFNVAKAGEYFVPPPLRRRLVPLHRREARSSTATAARPRKHERLACADGRANHTDPRPLLPGAWRSSPCSSSLPPRHRRLEKLLGPKL